MNHITLTIIIPCYNVESYLPACLACIESQSYKNFRCILVDDGSTDATGAICDELVKKDSRFQVLHIQNSGSSVARRRGLELCDTEYVTFVDSDDFIHPDTYRILMDNLTEHKDADILVYGVADCVDGEEIFWQRYVVTNNYEVVSQKDAVLRILDDTEWKSYMVNKIYRRALFDTIQFPIGRKLDEDFSIMHLVFHHAKLVLYNKSELCIYRHREGSICLSYDVKSMATKAYDRIAARWERLQFVLSHPEYAEMLNKVQNMYLAVALAVMRIVAKYPQHFPNHFFEERLTDIKSVTSTEYLPEYFNARKRIELHVLKALPRLFKLLYKFIPAW